MSLPDINTILKKHDALCVRTSNLEHYRAVCEMRFTEHGKFHDDIRAQLMRADVKFGMSLDEIKKDQKQLMHDLSKREGERNAMRWVPSIIQIGVWITIILAYIQK